MREIIDLVERSNLKVIFDFYHVQINEGDVTRRFVEFLGLIDHVQFANPPGWNEPGVGELDFDHIFHLIDLSGYAAWVGAEYFPSRNTQQSLGWFRDRGYLRYWNSSLAPGPLQPPTPPPGVDLLPSDPSPVMAHKEPYDVGDVRDVTHSAERADAVNIGDARGVAPAASRRSCQCPRPRQ